MKKQKAHQEGDFPSGLAQPARRALAGVGCERLEDLTRFNEAEIRALHGIGPRAFDQLQSALAARGLSFADRPGQ